MKCVSTLLGLALLLVVFVSEHNLDAAAPQWLTVRVTSRQDQPEGLRRHLEEGQVVDLSARISRPSLLPDNGRLRATWTLIEPDDPGLAPQRPPAGSSPQREVGKLEIGAPTANWSKLLHALDPDVAVTYRAPVSGVYELRVVVEDGPVTLFEGNRWREPGHVTRVTATPSQVAWPQTASVQVDLRLHSIPMKPSVNNDIAIEQEPNDVPELAQPIALRATTDEYTVHVVGSSDDIEYFDNGKVGRSGDDWFRLTFPGPEVRWLNVCLSIPDQQVAARIRVYRVRPDVKNVNWKAAAAGQLVPVEEYTEGRNENERSHQQTETHRIAVNRMMKPGEVYFLRVEANAPGYDLELRVVRPAPYDDPRRAIEQGLYDHIGQVDSWLTNRPRGASVERRIRDSGNLLGTNCMSCHTQSGVWGPAVPFVKGYRPRNVQMWRHLINTCYQSLRPTNVLKDAANNTSLRPLDLGDGPAGTRVAGHAVTALERFFPARRLQSKQGLRTANFVLQSGDPGGINAAGPGANVGQGVVFNYAGEIVATAWASTGEPRFFRAIEDKARRMLKIDVKYADDLGHRVEFFCRYFPDNYLEQAGRAAKLENLTLEEAEKRRDEAEKLAAEIRRQVEADLERLRGIQLEGGGWSFDPGQKTDSGWSVKDQKADPSPTSLALIAFEAAGFGKDDPTVSRGLSALMKLQHPTGLWKVASQTGFVSTSYALHALSRYFPAQRPTWADDAFHAADNETVLDTLRRVRDAAITCDPRFTGVHLSAATHESPYVRFWALLGLGYTNSPEGVDALIRGLGDSTRMVREAAHWSLRQTLMDDHGWDAVFVALKSGDDYTRESAIRALVMKVDTVLPDTSVDIQRLTAHFDHALNHDHHPAVRAWATRAAWQWWVWNPPVRKAINASWVALLQRPEPSQLVENAIRYQSHALFIANGHVANGSKEHQYTELADLFTALQDARSKSPAKERLTSRLVNIASTFYNQRGGDGGPGQMGYVTAGADRLFGEAVLAHLGRVEAQEDASQDIFNTLESAANIPFEALQERLVAYSIDGPEQFRSLAASSISDPRLVSLIAVPEKLEPMHRQLWRGAMEPARRKDLSDPILQMFGSVRWILPKSDEQREEILAFLVPDLANYRSPKERDTLAEADDRQRSAKDSDAAWYLAGGLGGAVAKNPDLQYEALAESLPDAFRNDAQARFWVQNIPWLLEFKRSLPEVRVDPKQLPPIDPYEELRTRALQLFLTQLQREADDRNRQIAANLANQTALKRNPEVLTALAAMLEFEKDKKIVENAKKVLSQNQQTFLNDLTTALAKEDDHGLPVDGNGAPKPPQEFIEDVTYFRDYVVPEMTKVLRGDERSCMICHGEPGRVPSMELHAPDQVGYLPVDKLLANYRILQQRVDIGDVEKSKLLRKPLNVQSGKEDGHQGGRRYQATDPGYQILKKWAMNQLQIQQKFGRSQPVVSGK